jgi:hypothetical protein
MRAELGTPIRKLRKVSLWGSFQVFTIVGIAAIKSAVAAITIASIGESAMSQSARAINEHMRHQISKRVTLKCHLFSIVAIQTTMRGKNPAQNIRSVVLHSAQEESAAPLPTSGANAQSDQVTIFGRVDPEIKSRI